MGLVPELNLQCKDITAVFFCASNLVTMPNSTSTPRRRVVREPLSRDRIEAEALVLIEDIGLEAFSTRKLGERLRCEAMSIYHHFPSKAHILDALVDRLLAALPIPAREQSPAHRLRAMSQSWRALSRQHPRFYLWMALHRWNSPTGIRFLSEVLACFSDAGLGPEHAARSFRVLGYYLLGATLDESSGYAEGPTAMQPMDEDDLREQYPAVAHAGRYFATDQFDATFELGLGVLLRGLGVEDNQGAGPGRVVIPKP